MNNGDVTTNNTRSSCINVTIPEVFNFPGARFIKVRHGEKSAFEKDWEEDGSGTNYPIDHFSLLSHLKSGGNYGIVSGFGNLGCFDADNFPKLEKYKVIKALDSLDTVVVQRGDHRHYYFFVDGEQSGKHDLADPNILKKDRKKENRKEWALGDVRIGGRFYTVGPNSLHPDGDYYRIISGTEIKHVPAEWLLDLIYYMEPVNQEIEHPKVNRKTLTDFLNLRVTDYLNPIGEVVKMGSVEQGSHPIHGSTTGHNFRVDSSMNTWSCFSSNCTHLMVKAVGGSGLEAYAVSKGLMECGDCVKGWSDANPDLFKKIVSHLRQDGYGKKIDEWYGNTPEVTKPRLTSMVAPDAPKDHPRMKIELRSGNWIENYINYCKKELPQVYEDFFLAGALTLLSIATDRRVVMYPAGRAHYTVLWSMVLGKSSISHKSDLFSELRQSVWLYFPNSELKIPGSAAGLFDDLAEKPRSCLLLEEASSLLSNINNNSEAGQARGLFCRIYDCDDKIEKSLSKRNKEAPEPIKNPFVPMLWFIQPAQFSKNTSSLDVESGFLPRFLYFHPNYVKAPVPIKFGVQRNMNGENVYRQFKAIIAKIHEHNNIRVCFTDEAMKILNDWQMKEEMEIQENHEDVYKPSVFTRALVNTAKLAALITIADEDFFIEPDDKAVWGGESRITVEADNMQRAVNLMSEYFIPHALLTIEQIGINEEKNIQDKIIMKLRARGGQLTRTELGRAMRNITKKVLTEHIETLAEFDVISVAPGNTGGRPSEIITLNI